MELSKQGFLADTCEAQHIRVDQWYVRHSLASRVDQWREPPIEHDLRELREQKFRRRLGKWLRKPTAEAADYAPSPPNAKLTEAKKQHFTGKGKEERVAKSLAALSQPSDIQLTPDEWREIVEDSGLEDQF